ncbi:MAG TPA: polysaccharide pyruvyl transferase family protein, partial [Alphaproteobacteria bacterium]
MARVLVMIPSGEVYDHDCVRWYNYANVQANLEHYHNIGDAFVFDSSLKLLNFETLDVLKIRSATQADIDRYNAEFDYCFLRGSNYIHGEM